MRVEQREPGRTHGETELQFSGGEVNAGAGNGFGVESDEGICAKAVVHVIPAQQKSLTFTTHIAQQTKVIYRKIDTVLSRILPGLFDNTSLTIERSVASDMQHSLVGAQTEAALND